MSLIDNATFCMRQPRRQSAAKIATWGANRPVLRHDAQHDHLRCCTRVQAATDEKPHQVGAQEQTHASDSPASSCLYKPNHTSDSDDMHDRRSCLSASAQTLHRALCNGHFSVGIKSFPHSYGCRMCGAIYRHTGPGRHCSRHTAADPLSHGISLHAVLLFEALSLSFLSRSPSLTACALSHALHTASMTLVRQTILSCNHVRRWQGGAR